eukprot:364379-Chlamydomonas_euryale.AAC.8
MEGADAAQGGDRCDVRAGGAGRGLVSTGGRLSVDIVGCVFVCTCMCSVRKGRGTRVSTCVDREHMAGDAPRYMAVAASTESMWRKTP